MKRRTLLSLFPAAAIATPRAGMADTMLDLACREFSLDCGQFRPGQETVGPSFAMIRRVILESNHEDDDAYVVLVAPGDAGGFIQCYRCDKNFYQLEVRIFPRCLDTDDLVLAPLLRACLPPDHLGHFGDDDLFCFDRVEEAFYQFALDPRRAPMLEHIVWRDVSDEVPEAEELI